MNVCRSLSGTVLAMTLCGCTCEPVVRGVLATDTLPPAPVTERAYRLIVPASGDLMVAFSRQDGREGYAGSVYLFVTMSDCMSVSSDPLSMRDGQTFRPLCSVLANSYKDLNCCQGNVTLATPARVRKGQEVKVFLYGLYQPSALPYQLSYEAGDAACTETRVTEGSVQVETPWNSKLAPEPRGRFLGGDSFVRVGVIRSTGASRSVRSMKSSRIFRMELASSSTWASTSASAARPDYGVSGKRVA